MSERNLNCAADLIVVRKFLNFLREKIGGGQSPRHPELVSGRRRTKFHAYFIFKTNRFRHFMTNSCF